MTVPCAQSRAGAELARSSGQKVVQNDAPADAALQNARVLGLRVVRRPQRGARAAALCAPPHVARGL